MEEAGGFGKVKECQKKKKKNPQTKKLPKKGENPL